MATYFHGGSQEMTHPDGFQALLLMNHGYATCPTADPAFFQNPTFYSPILREQQHLYCQPPPPPPPPPTQQQNYAVYWPESAEEDGARALQRILVGSKFLKATQQLLEEVVDVGRESKDGSPKTPRKLVEVEGGKPTAALVAVEKQELQMKKAKLTHLLIEVEQRYKQYEEQMREATSSFESIAGVGSARTYTALALRTISRQFRSLKDAIGGQIRAAGKSLGEEEYPWGSLLESRQKRVLEQHNAWRPQRGLPERSVSILRAWLFEHFLHPYPKDSDKLLLAKKTGLTRNQVSNWFINARVRLWKPMVEEMYVEEMKGQDPTNDGGIAGTGNGDRNKGDSTTVPPSGSQSIVEKVDENNGVQQKQQQLDTKKGGVCDLLPLNSMEMEAKMGDQHGYNLHPLTSGSYPIEETGGFHGNGVSLTLGLPRTGISQPQASYLDDGYLIGRRFGMVAEADDQYRNLNGGGSNPTVTSDYNGIGIQNRKGFAAQLLPDFVT